MDPTQHIEIQDLIYKLQSLDEILAANLQTSTDTFDIYSQNVTKLLELLRTLLPK